MNKEVLLSELNFKAVRSSGAGGQNVNKVASKMVLIFDVFSTLGLNEEERTRVQTKLKSKISQENLLILTCDEDRSQLKNKKIITQRFFDLLEKALQVPKVRKATTVSKSAKEKRLQEKKKAGEIKANRRKLDF
ncbi:Probable protein chain release factor [Flavobacterium indicum GPTSA100-9 = DSM 17447]|uniref:Probable protein chain release factor n=1 Tax=Flavobacterium indicum (strain DSM 17447 / CIP 109464 / GPTSA100-9) TaxID=1094466 RepID=H8XQC1_FLAIG|nr:alternative ribosome rescue aminoacyl-tRNA hydrolase ArfB [Flavobacterium indicum]CCG52415.1 Probable protein chain release factor [Flavobacterium indicum GPTSA100-9 = DSM 17447]